jgi:hypothetical protein
MASASAHRNLNWPRGAPELTPNASPRHGWNYSKQPEDLRRGVCRASSGALVGFLGKRPSVNLFVTSVTGVPSLSLTPYKTYPLLTYTSLLMTVVTVVTMPMPQWFLVSPVIDRHQFQRGDVLGLAFLRHRFAVFVDPFVTGPDLNP